MAEEISRKSVIYEIGYDFSKGNKEAQTADQNLKKIDKDADKLTNTFKQANGAFKTAFETDKAIKFGQELLQVSARATTLQGRLRAMRNELAGLDEGSARFQKLAIEAAKLEDKIGDVNQRVRNLASDTKNLDAFVSIAQGIAGGFAIAQGAAALFGDENEELQKTLLKVQASIAILNGLQQVSATIQNESAAKTFIVTNAQKLYTFVTNGATAATRALNLAFAATIGGVILAGLAAIVVYWKDISKFIGISNENAEDFNKTQLSILDKRIKLAEIAGKQTFDLREKQLREELRQQETSAKRQIEILGELEVLKAQKDISFAKEQVNREKESIERRLVLVKRGSAEELELRRQLIDAERKLELYGTQRTQGEIIEILKVAEKKKKDLQLTGLNSLTERISIFNELLNKTDVTTESGKRQVGFYAREIAKLKDEIEDILTPFAALQDAITKIVKVSQDSTLINDSYRKSLQELNRARGAEEISAEEFVKKTVTLNKEHEKSIINLTDATRKYNEIIAEQVSVPREDANGILEDNIELTQKYLVASQEINNAFQAFTDLNNFAYKRDADNLRRALEEKKISQEQYNQSIAKLNKDRAKEDAAFALADIAISSGVAIANIIKAATNSALTAPEAIAQIFAGVAVVLANIAKATQAVQAARYEEGTPFLQRGKSKPGKDTIPLYGNEGEAIIPTDKNAQEPGLAKAWINGDLDRYIYRNYVMPEMLKATGKGRTDKDYSEKFYKQYLATQEQTYKQVSLLKSIDSKLNGGADYRSRYGRA